MAIFKEIAGLRHWRQALKGTLALVPTMGNLHAGHLALVRMAAARADHVLVSIYVNPLQFGPGEDFDRYPRNLGSDLQLLGEAGCQNVFAPDDNAMYPYGRQDLAIVLPPRSLSSVLCGRSRPGHFAGVSTVLSKLLHMVAPEVLVLGEKDYQQLRVVQRLLEDCNFAVQLLPAPTQREADGLAYSSRNQYLSTEERRIAPLLFQHLQELVRRSKESDADPALLAQATRESLELAGFAVEYLELRDGTSLQSLPHARPGARWFAAARLGRTRLIDNLAIDL